MVCAWQRLAPSAVETRVPSRSSVYRYTKEWDTTLLLDQRSRPGRAGKLSTDNKKIFRLWALGQGKFTLDQAGLALYHITGRRMHRTGVGVLLGKLGLTRKKGTLVHPQRDEGEVQEFYAGLRHQNISVDQLVRSFALFVSFQCFHPWVEPMIAGPRCCWQMVPLFSHSGLPPPHQVSVDEVGFRGTELFMKHGWSEKGERFVDYEPLANSGQRYEGLAAIAHDGLVALQIYTGGTTQWPTVVDFFSNHLLDNMNPWPVSDVDISEEGSYLMLIDLCMPQPYAKKIPWRKGGVVNLKGGVVKLTTS